jgi:hypothetical protein
MAALLQSGIHVRECPCRCGPSAIEAQAPRPVGSNALPNCGTACRNVGIRVTKQQPLTRNFFAVLPTSRHAQRPSISYRGRRVTDEAFRSQEGEPTAGCPANVFRVFCACGSPKRRCGLLLAPGVDSCAKPSRSCATIQVLFCVAELWKRYAESSDFPGLNGPVAKP